MHKYFLCLLLFSASTLLGVDFSDNQKIAVQNTILAQVNGHTISVIDVKKKLDLAFHKNYAHLEHSPQALFQFYETSWKSVLTEMISHQLILADASEKGIPLSDGEIREEMEGRFGPNIMLTLDKIGLTYDETWQLIKDELIVQRMTWWFIHSKAINQVTPQDIRQAFRVHLKEHPAYDQWTYQVISIRGANSEEIASKVYHSLKEHGLRDIQTIDPSVQISSEFCATDKELSEAHFAALSKLSPGEYSLPTFQKSKQAGETVARIFCLKEKTNYPAAQFEALLPNLRSELIQKAAMQESNAYLGKLRKSYAYYENVPNDLHPFSLR